MARTSKKRSKKRQIFPAAAIFSILGSILIATVALFILMDLYQSQVHKPVNLISYYPTPEEPISIIIKGVLNELPLKPGHIKNDEWELATSSALFLTTSGNVGKPGNMVIYGHNTQNVFGNLTYVHTKDVIQIRTSFNHTYMYQVKSIKTISAYDTSILQQSDESTITLFTCTGLFDSERLVIQGVLLPVSSMGTLYSYSY